MIDAAKRASANRITAVCPYYGYSRQDRKSKGREPITARLVSDFFATAGADRIISVDLHSGQIQGFFDGPVDHLTAVPLLTEYLRQNAPSGDFVMVVARHRPVQGRRAGRPPRRGAGGVASVYKRRPKDVVNQVEALDVMGDVEGRHVRAHRRHDRHRRHDLRRRRAADRQGRHRGLGHVHPRRALRPGHRPPEELADLPGGGHRHLAPAGGEADRQDRGGVGGADLRRRHRRRLRGRSVSEIFGGENQT